MFFNSFTFIGFLIVVICAVFITKLFRHKLLIRNLILLIASYYFYGCFNWVFTLILASVTIINYIGGNLLFIIADKYKKLIVGITVSLSLLPLIFFKYTLFICKSLSSLLSFEINVELLNGIMLPVGISFFTFQALSYIIDVYRNKISIKPNLLEFALFVSFFPTILSGPIEKARNLLPQIRRYFLPSTADITQGICIFIWGLFKKMVVADRLAEYVDWAYATHLSASGSTLALAAIFYSIQIYCDFSGYSDMALGIAKTIGFDVTKNFRQPYFSRTFKDFWRKWHIALTSWFTEYVYFSLGGSRVRYKIKWIFNISTIFILSGIWHGAAWNFLIWGGLHACYYLAEHFLGLQKKDIKWTHMKSIISGLTVFVLATIAWVFFRIETFESAIFILNKICCNLISPISLGASTFSFFGTVIMLVIFLCYELLVRKNLILYDVTGYTLTLGRNIISTIPMLILIGMFGITSDNFVYFQF